MVTNTRTATSAAASSTSSVAPSSSTNAAPIIGAVGGGIVGAIVIAIIAAFIIRRMRKKRDNRALNFDPDNFRRSAVLLDDNDVPIPSMAERRTPTAGASYGYTDTPQEPSATYGSSEGQYHNYGASQYSAAPGGVYSPQVAAGGYGSQYEQNDYGAPPVPGQHGPGSFANYGTYGAAVAGGYQARQYQEYSSGPSYQQSEGYGAAAVPYGPNGTRSPPSSESHETSASPNPIARSPSSAAPQPDVSRAPTSGLSRQPTQSGNTPPAYSDDAGQYTELNRDQKVNPAGRHVQNGSAGDHATAKGRPTSAYTVYDPEDAYGGM